MHAALSLVSAVLAAADPGSGPSIPDPGRGIAPPGSGGALTVLKWVAWVTLGICVGGLMVTGAQMAAASRRGEGGEHMSRLGWTFGGAMVIGSAAGLIAAVL